jgi:hypothetical protein
MEDLKQEELKASLDSMFASLPESGSNAAGIWTMYAEEYADAYSKQEHARIRVRRVEARLRHTVAEDPKGHGLAKNTVAQIEGWIIKQTEYQDSYAAYIAAQRDYKLAREQLDVIRSVAMTTLGFCNVARLVDDNATTAEEKA